MRLFSYVVVRDYGFAPNPFYAYCTLSACKPVIRRVAEIGDWILGTGSTTCGRESHVVFAMRVTQSLTFDEYWRDPRFQRKRPMLRGSKKQAFGDNIYHRLPVAGEWAQADSHHSCDDGSPNLNNVERDTGTDRVLISDDFIYFGGEGPRLPARFRGGNADIRKKGAGHKSKFPAEVIDDFVRWIRGLPHDGYSGEPRDWLRTP